jgi:hypothetical protein
MKWYVAAEFGVGAAGCFVTDVTGVVESWECGAAAQAMMTKGINAARSPLPISGNRGMVVDRARTACLFCTMAFIEIGWM